MSKIKSKIHTLIMMLKEEKIKPIIVPTDENKLLSGKIALITGGSSGIGYAIAKQFLTCGAKVIICGTNINKLNDAIDKLSIISSNIKGIIIDVRDTKSLKNKIEQAEKLYDEKRIDILVNSAGVVEKHDFWNIDESEYDKIMDTNAKGTFFMCQNVARIMKENHIKGHILNISSSAALRPAWTPYQMSKWSIKGFTLGLADILIKDGIVVNAIAPGPTATPMMGMDNSTNIYNENIVSKRYGMPEEIASLAVYLVSGAGDLIVGDTVYATGGSGLITLHH